MDQHKQEGCESASEERQKQIPISDHVCQKPMEKQCDLFLAAWKGRLSNASVSLTLPLPLPILISNSTSISRLELSVQDTLSVVLFRCLIGKTMYLMSNCVTASSAQDLASIELFDTLEKILDIYDMSSVWAAKQFAIEVMSIANLLKDIYEFIKFVYEARSKGIKLNVYLPQCSFKLSYFLVQWMSGNNKICHQIVENGWIAHHLFILYCLRDAGLDVKNVVMQEMSAVLKCSEAVDIQHCFKHPRWNCVTIFSPYANSPDLTIQLFAFMILSKIIPLLSSSEISHCMRLNTVIMSTVWQALQEASTETNPVKTIFCFRMPTEKLVHMILNTLIEPHNTEFIINNNPVPVLVSLLGCGTVDVQKAACSLTWKLTMDAAFRVQIAVASDYPMIEVLQTLQNSADSELSSLAWCSLFCLGSITDTGASSLLNYAGSLYEYGYYTESLDTCEMIVDSNLTTEQRHLKSKTQGKANFQIYRSTQHQLEKEADLHKIYSKSGQIKYKECYQKAKATVSLLGAVCDNGLLETDEEFQMLDVAMIDYMLSTNSLDRCLLCHKKAKLQRSHYFPKALLEEFCQGFSAPTNLKILRPGASHTGSDMSPKEFTFLMLCSSCELLLNKYGESQFYLQFFKRIYDTNVPSNVKAEQTIEYDEWLYFFCIGIIFRMIAVYHNEQFFNKNELMYLLRICRELLLSVPHITDCPHKPDVAILLSPQDVENSPMSMTSVLNPIACYLMIPDISFYSSMLQCIVVRIGIINIVYVLDAGRLGTAIPEEYYINPNGGLYHIPAAHFRQAKIPANIWRIFELIAISNTENYLNWPSKAADSLAKKKLKKPQEEVQDMFQLETSGDGQPSHKEVATYHIRPSVDESVPLVINFLPEEFVISPTYDKSQVFLPDNHKVVFHATNKVDSLEITIFLVVGLGSLYSFDKPYVIYHSSSPGLQFSIGFFISTENFTVLEMLPDKKPKLLLRDTHLHKIEEAKLIIPTMMNDAIANKGIDSYGSLVAQLSASWNDDCCFDVKCSTSNCCWYCMPKCSICMNPASFGYCVSHFDRKVYKFCSETCQAYTSMSEDENPSVLLVNDVFDGFPSQMRTHKIHQDHKEIMYVHLQGHFSSGWYGTVNITLCTNEGSNNFPENMVYAVYYCRTLSQQNLFEFFISEECQPIQPLPTASDKMKSVIEGLQRTGHVKDLISAALKMKGYPSLQFLLNLCKTSQIM